MPTYVVNVGPAENEHSHAPSRRSALSQVMARLFRRHKPWMFDGQHYWNIGTIVNAIYDSMDPDYTEDVEALLERNGYVKEVPAPAVHPAPPTPPVRPSDEQQSFNFGDSITKTLFGTISEVSIKMGKRKTSAGGSPKSDGPTDMRSVVYNMVHTRIKEGDSRLSMTLGKGYTMDHVAYAIKAHKCLDDLGSTYLEQIVGSTIKDLIKTGKLYLQQINNYRGLFNMPPLGADGRAKVSGVEEIPGHKDPHRKRSQRKRYDELF